MIMALFFLLFFSFISGCSMSSALLQTIIKKILANFLMERRGEGEMFSHVNQSQSTDDDDDIFLLLLLLFSSSSSSSSFIPGKYNLNVEPPTPTPTALQVQ